MSYEASDLDAAFLSLAEAIEAVTSMDEIIAIRTGLESLSELMERKRTDIAAEKRDEVRREIEAKAAMYGLDVDIRVRNPSSARKRRSANANSDRRGIEGKAVRNGAPSPVTYRFPDGEEVLWKGVGRRPARVVDWIERNGDDQAIRLFDVDSGSPRD